MSDFLQDRDVRFMVGGPLHMKRIALPPGKHQESYTIKHAAPVGPCDQGNMPTREIKYTRRQWMGNIVYVPEHMPNAQAFELLMISAFGQMCRQDIKTDD